MRAFERRRHSLAAKSARATVAACILLAMVALFVGLGFYGYDLSRQYINHAFNLSGQAAVSAKHGADSRSVANEVMSIYRDLSEAERQTVGTAAYHARFAHIEENADYRLLNHMLGGVLENNGDVFDVYLAMYDRDTTAMVYIVDPDPEDPLAPGEWEPVTQKGMEKFLSWDGTGTLYNIDRTEKYGWLCTAGTPIRGDDGEIYAFLLVDVSIDSVISGMAVFALQLIIALLIVTALMAWLLARRMKRSLVEPINSIAEAALAYVRDRREGLAKTTHFADLNVHTGDEVENLALIMSDMEQDLTKIEADLTAVTAKNERISTELTLATRIQAAFVPHIFPPFPNRPEFDLYASMDPAKEVGGDFYDFFLIDEDHLALVMADVSGKGVPAALFMMVSKIILQSCAMLGKSPAEILKKTNEAICSNNQEDMFVTVWLGILEISTGKLTAANAGHEYPMLRTPNGGFDLYKDRHGFVIGGMSGSRYREYELQLQPGSKLFVYTDGVSEAKNVQKELFGTERILAALNRVPEASPQTILQNVRQAVDGFVQEAEQFDDLTMLCLEYKGAQRKTPLKELTVDATVENVRTVTDFVNEVLDEANCPLDTRRQLNIVIDEVFSNIAQYAYGSALGAATVKAGLEDDGRTLVLIFQDGGMPYDPLSAKDPDTSLSAKDRPMGGLGILLVKKLMDEKTYVYENGQNVLTLKKKL